MTWCRRVREIADSAVVVLWAGVFAILGRVQPAKQYWVPCGGQRVLVVAPHPDDEALGCGGTIARHLACGDSVDVLIVTDGRQSRAYGLAPDDMAAARRDEAEAAARLMSLSNMIWLGLREGEWETGELEKALSGMIDASRPDIVYAPCWLDYHPEHRRVAECLADAVPDDCRVRIYTLHIPLGQLANVRVDVSRDVEKIEAVFASYRTQETSLVRGLRLRRYAAALGCLGKATEEFFELGGTAYSRSHKRGMPGPVVRGLRYWSFSDPLAYYIGRKSRAALARLASDD